MPRSSSGLGRRPLTPVTRVQIPYGVQKEDLETLSRWLVFRDFSYGLKSCLLFACALDDENRGVVAALASDQCVFGHGTAHLISLAGYWASNV